MSRTLRRLAPLALPLLAACADPDAPPGGVVLVSVDTLRADRLGVYGHARPTTPEIDAFARRATVFTRGFAHSSETRFSMASLLTGFLPHETRVTELEHLPDEVETLPEILKRHGYRTAAVVSNYVLRGARGWSQGFDVYDDEMSQHEAARRWPERIAEDTTDRAIEALEALRGSPFLLWVHYQDPHGPYTPPERFRSLFRDPAQEPRPLRLNPSLSGRGGIPRYQRLEDERDFYVYLARYEGEIRYLDQEVGRLLAALRRLGLEDRSLLVFTADHGESLGEHDHYFAHMEYLYGELTHVPLIVRFGADEAGTRTEFVQHLDLLPTILAFLGLPEPEGLRGRDLRQPPEEDAEIFAEVNLPFVRDGRRAALTWDGFRLIHSRPDDRFELYDLAADPAETHDLAGDPGQTARLEGMKARLLRLQAEDRLGLVAPGPAPALSEQERRNLEALGYVRD